MLEKLSRFFMLIRFKGRGNPDLKPDTAKGTNGKIVETIAVSNDTRIAPAPEWSVIEATARGATHQRNNLPNQDSIGSSDPNQGLPIVLAVADGHGGKKYFRSQVGARLAVETALEAIPRFFEKPVEETTDVAEGQTSDPDRILDKQTLEVHIPRRLIGDWITKVRDHLENNRIEVTELANLDARERNAFIDCSSKHKTLTEKKAAGMSLSDDEEKEIAVSEAKLLQAYGATLLVGAVSDRNIFYWQLGDGDIISVSASGEVSNVMPNDARLFANETTSLCVSQVKDFRVAAQAISDHDQLPALIMLSTDGYSNSYSSPRGFETVGKDLLNLICEENGFEKVKNNLEGWLEQTSRDGSGDDITVGLLVSTVVIKELAKIKRDDQSAIPEVRAESEPANAVKQKSDTGDKPVDSQTQLETSS